MPPKAPAGKAPAKGAKGPPAALAALKSQMKRIKEEEERRKREEEEEIRRIEEEEKRQKEEEEAKALEKLRKSSNKNLDANKRKLLEQQKRLEEFRKAGYVVPDINLEETEEAPGEKKQAKRALDVGKKKKPQKAAKGPEMTVERSENTVTQPSAKSTQMSNPLTPDAQNLPTPGMSSLDAASATTNHFVANEEDVVDCWMELADTSLKQSEIAAMIFSPEQQMRNQMTTSEENDRKSLIAQELKRRKIAKTEEEKSVKEQQNKGLRSPICCVLGHVDAGKTSLLDKLRRTNVQGGEAGGITQQIGATFFPLKNLVDQTKELAEQYNFTVRIPGLLVIDTPGHESFTNLRSRGSSLCDLAIVVVDFMKGIEPQTRESLNLLRQRKCNFVVVMNKVDRLYGWKAQPGKSIQAALKAQERFVDQEYETRVHNIKSQLMTEGFNSELYYNCKDFRKVVALVPVSARSGEGIPDLLALLVQIIQKFMEAKVTASGELECTVLDVKKMEGQGTTLDVILVNGQLHLGDTIVCCGFNGAIVTTIKALMTPQPCKELRTKGEYVYHKEVHAAVGCKLVAHDLDEAVAGTPLFVVHDPHNAAELERVKADVMKDLDSLKIMEHSSGSGVMVQTSTLGSLEALMKFLKDNHVPVGFIGIGPVHKRHIIQLTTGGKKNEQSVLLAFDVPITREAQEIADAHNIKIFQGDVIYKLFDAFVEYKKALADKLMESNKNLAIFPVEIQTLPGSVFRTSDPILIGVEVLRGQLRLNTPLFTFKDGEMVRVGRVSGVQKEGSDVAVSKVGSKVSVAIQSHGNMVVGRHIPTDAIYYSELTRSSIDALKESFRDEMSMEDWKLVVSLKSTLGIM